MFSQVTIKRCHQIFQIFWFKVWDHSLVVIHQSVPITSISILTNFTPASWKDLDVNFSLIGSKEGLFVGCRIRRSNSDHFNIILKVKSQQNGGKLTYSPSALIPTNLILFLMQYLFRTASVGNTLRSILILPCGFYSCCCTQ